MSTFRIANFSFLYFALFIVQILSGCALTPQQANVDPEIIVNGDDIGHQRILGLKVEEERSDNSLGRRGTGAMSGAAITANQDVTVVFHQEIADGFMQRGFNVVPYSKDQPLRISVELRELKYSTSMGFWTGGVHMNAAMKVEAFREDREFEHFYRCAEEQRKLFVNFADENEAIINAAASELLQQLFDDQKLSEFLAD